MNIRDNDNIYVAMASGTPSYLLNKLSKVKAKNLKIYHMLTFGNLDYLKNSSFSHISLFNGQNSRSYINDSGNFVPVHFSQIPRLMRIGRIPVDVVLLETSPPDENGFYSLGLSVECLPAAIEVANRVIVCVNKNVPRTNGYKLHPSKITEIFESDNELHLYENKKTIRPEELEVAHRVAELIPSGSTIQTGIGSVPSLVLNNLLNKKNIYIHTECLFDSAIDLLANGVAIGATCTLAMGGKKIIDYVDDNKNILFLPVDFVNDPKEIAKKNIYAINSAISIDFLGQCSSDCIGHQIYSGFGGIVDFMRGASCGGGLSILATTSKTNKGHFKFCEKLNSPVTLTRADVDVIVTEHGIADLRGTTMNERSKLIKKIAGLK